MPLRRSSLAVFLAALGFSLSPVGALGAPPGARARPAPGHWPALLSARGVRPSIAAPGSGRVPVTFRLQAGESAADLGAIELAPGLAARRVPYGELGAFVEANAARRPWVSPPLRTLLDRSGSLWTRANEAHALGALGRGVAVGIIDTGVDLTHPDFLDAQGHSRIAWMLDFAREPLGLHPELEARFGCSGQAPNEGCAVLSAADIERESGDASAPSGDLVGHGSHVASIAAGNGGPMARYIGIAPEATLVAVRAVRSGNGSIEDVNVISGARFVFDRATELGLPAVANISLGGDFGPHDGTSPLEAGLAALIGDNLPGRAIVVAAGNSGGLCVAEDGRLLGGHTEGRVLPGTTTRLPLAVEGPKPDEDIPGALYVWITFQAGDEVSVGIEKNGKPLLDPVAPGEEASVDDPKGRKDGDAGVSVAVLNGPSADDGVGSSSNGAIVVIDGTWKGADAFAVTLEGRGVARAWLQGGGNAESAGCTGALFPRAIKEGTVNIPASHPDLLSVGCTLNRRDWLTATGQEVGISRLGSVVDPPGDTTCFFSSAGPNALGTPKPEISAPGAFVVAAMGASARPSANPVSMFASPSGACPNDDQCLVVDGEHALASGTSMSSPHVTGAVALMLEREPRLTEAEIISFLQAGERRFAGVVSFDYQAGPGALSVIGALAALDEQAAPRGLAPDPAQSWVHVSTGLARPDGRFPVVVTIQARAADGSIAHGFAEPIALRTENAAVLSPPQLKAPGLWRAVLAAPPGLGGQSLHVAATYQGAQLGEEKVLPIEVDSWARVEAAQAHGGCSAAPVGGPSGPRRALGAVLGFAALARLARLGWQRVRARRAQAARVAQKRSLSGGARPVGPHSAKIAIVPPCGS